MELQYWLLSPEVRKCFGTIIRAKSAFGISGSVAVTKAKCQYWLHTVNLSSEMVNNLTDPPYYNAVYAR